MTAQRVGPPQVRDAGSADLPAMLDIYAHHVRHGLASFEEVAPEPAEFERRWRMLTGHGLPWLAAEQAGEVLGYAYAAPYRTRPAYRYALEDSIYVHPGRPRRGAGRALLTALIVRCEALGCRQLIAVIGDTANVASIGLHASLGFQGVGTLRSVGWKLGRWVDSYLMQRPLGGGDAAPPSGQS